MEMPGWLAALQSDALSQSISAMTTGRPSVVHGTKVYAPVPSGRSFLRRLRIRKCYGLSAGNASMSIQAEQPWRDLMSTARPNATTCDHACGETPVAEESRAPALLDKVLALACVTFFLFLAVAGSRWILADVSATLLSLHHVH
jgi:hypothetical protein